MRFRNKHNNNEENFWLSATDMMAGILIIVLLLLLLFLLYLNMSKDEVMSPLDATELSDKEYNETSAHEFESVHAATEFNIETTGEGQGDVTLPPTEPPTEPEPGRNNEEGEDDRAAVFVTVVDADSGNTIKKRGIEFELYANKNGIGGLQTLSSYYQEVIEYKKFETGDNGTFYLPEKISKGWYSLRNLSTPEGYYINENTDFEIDEHWEWKEPYMVTVEMKPIKKTVRVSAEDSKTAEPMENVGFQVVASGEVKAADGTVRYQSGEVVDEIKTDEKGYAESKELYIGSYYIKQISSPEYYAVNKQVIPTSVNEDQGAETGLIKVECSKTSVTVRLTNERTSVPIEGAVYTMEDRDDLVTDSNGEFTITDLTKSTAYELTLSSVPDGYIKKEDKLSFKVDSEGRVLDSVAAVIEDTAYTISLNVEAKDFIFGRKAKGVDLQVLDENEEVIDEWTTNDAAYIVNGLKEGKYFVQKAGDKNSRVIVNLKDTADLQTAEILIWDTIDLFALLMAAGLIILAGFVIWFTVTRKKKVKRTNEK